MTTVRERLQQIVRQRGVLFAVVLLIALLFLYLGVIWTGVDSTRYASRAAADSAGAFRNGWLPAFVPPSAINLHETHAPGSHERWLTFSAQADELRRLSDSMSLLSFAEMEPLRPRLPWWLRASWPAELQKPLVMTPRATLRVYYMDQISYCLAIDWRANKGYAWSCHRPLASALRG